MTLAYIVGPVIALIVFLIFLTDKWEVVIHGTTADRDKIYQRYHQLQKLNVRCKVVRTDAKLPNQGPVLQLLVMDKDLAKGKYLLSLVRGSDPQ